MRIVIVGASKIAVALARRVIDRNETVVLIDRSREKLEEVGEKLDCGMLHGDGTDPEILREARGDQGGTLIAVTPEDQDNILSCLLAKSLGFERVMPRIGRPQLFAICDELGLDERVAPEEEIAERLTEKLYESGENTSNALQWPARLFSFAIHSNTGLKTVGNVQLPPNSRAVCVYRGESYFPAEDQQSLQEGDRLAIVTDATGVDKLCDQYGVQTSHD